MKTPETTESQATEPPPTELVSFDDPTEHRTWVFDVTFLTSSWACIFGRGCPGVLTEPASELEQGCCSYGAHLVDREDAATVSAAAERLTDAQWHNRRVARRRGGPLRVTPGGGQATRLVDDVCIFHNPSGFAGGTGCALHLAALHADERPLDWKPDVCWQVPLRRVDLVEDDGHVVSTLRRWRRRDWGEGGEEFHWWCTEDPGADDGHEPVYRALRDEIIELVGTWAYDRFVRFAADRGGRKVTTGGNPVVQPQPPGQPVNIAPGTHHRAAARP